MGLKEKYLEQSKVQKSPDLSAKLRFLWSPKACSSVLGFSFSSFEASAPMSLGRPSTSTVGCPGSSTDSTGSAWEGGISGVPFSATSGPSIRKDGSTDGFFPNLKLRQKDALQMHVASVDYQKPVHWPDCLQVLKHDSRCEIEPTSGGHDISRTEIRLIPLQMAMLQPRVRRTKCWRSSKIFC